MADQKVRSSDQKKSQGNEVKKNTNSAYKKSRDVHPETVPSNDIIIVLLIYSNTTDIIITLDIQVY